MDPHVPDDRAGDDGAQRDAQQDPHAVVPGQEETHVDSNTDRNQEITFSSQPLSDVVRGTPWINRQGGPAYLWRAYFGFGIGALDLTEFLGDLCLPKGVTVDIKGVDEYAGRAELIDVHGVLCVFSSESPDSWRPGETSMFRQIVRDFRAIRPITAVDGFYLDPKLWHRAGVLQAFYTDYALEDSDCTEIIEEACAGHLYTPGAPFSGNIFEVFERGKAPKVRENDQVATTRAALWKLLRRWGVDAVDRVRLVRYEIECEVDVLENPAKRAMYRPIHGVDRNQLWLVLHDPDARPPVDRNKTEEENRDAERLFVANGARAVRDLVERLESTFEWFQQPEELKRRGAQRHFARLYEALRTITRHS